MASNIPADSDVRIALITNPADIGPAFTITATSLGHQVNDTIFTTLNPAWDTPAGNAAGAQRMIGRWHSITKDRNGDPNTVFLKAVVPASSGEDGAQTEQIVGFAIWEQSSVVDGHGDPPVDDIGTVLDLEAMYPGNEAEQRYARQLDASLHRPRRTVVREKATASPPAVFVLDLCVVQPEFQRRGIAGELVRWGVEEAARRGGLECLTEASKMGRGVYARFGFVQIGEIEYVVDEEFRERERPSNVFMRTGGS